MRDKFLTGIEDIPFKEDLPLSGYFTIGTGGRADYAFFPEDIGQLKRLVNKFTAEEVKYRVVGNGSNTLPLGDRFRGCILFVRGVNGIREEDGKIFAECGATVREIIDFSLERGIDCATSLYGIPACIGGAAYMNAGSRFGYFSDIADKVLVTDGRESFELSASECRFSYKHSLFMESGYIILGSWLKASYRPEQFIRDKISIIQKSRMWLPKGRSMGCIFKNPENGSAGEIIDGCGLKGIRRGGAFISEEHANFIINGGGATSSDVLSLIQYVKERVFKLTGITLREEIIYLE